MSIWGRLVVLAVCLLSILRLTSGGAEAYELSLGDELHARLSLENTAIFACRADTHENFHNRLRADLELQQENYPALLAKLVVDNGTDYAAATDTIHNNGSVYRAYIQSRGAKHMWSLGRQRIPLGVGRVWNPIDIFNPIDPQQIEPDERAGTESLRYEYAINELSNLDTTIAKDRAALRIKSYLHSADVALVGLWDESSAQDILGWEIEGQLLDTGVELRSEGGSFGAHDTGERSTHFIIGAEYGFSNSFNLLTEYSFSDDDTDDYLAFQASIQPQILWFCRLLVLANLGDASYFISPSLEYSLSDDMTISAGAFVYASEDGEFSGQADSYYLHWFVHF